MSSLIGYQQKGIRGRLLMTAKLMSRSVCFEPISKSALYQGTTSVVLKRASRTRGFKPLRRHFPLNSVSAAFGSSTCEEDITFAAFNSARQPSFSINEEPWTD
jgi:hypothetical protein